MSDRLFNLLVHYTRGLLFLVDKWTSDSMVPLWESLKSMWNVFTKFYLSTGSNKSFVVRYCMWCSFHICEFCWGLKTTIEQGLFIILHRFRIVLLLVVMSFFVSPTEPVSSVLQVNSNATEMWQFNSLTESLSCTSSGSSFFPLVERQVWGHSQRQGPPHWWSLVSVSHFDQGPFRCRVSCQ